MCDEKEVFGVYKELQYFLCLQNAKDLISTTSFLARTGHVELQATTHVNTSEQRHTVSDNGEKGAPERWPGQGQSVATPSNPDESSIHG